MDMHSPVIGTPVVTNVRVTTPAAHLNDDDIDLDTDDLTPARPVGDTMPPEYMALFLASSLGETGFEYTSRVTDKNAEYFCGGAARTIMKWSKKTLLSGESIDRAEISPWKALGYLAAPFDAVLDDERGADLDGLDVTTFRVLMPKKAGEIPIHKQLHFVQLDTSTKQALWHWGREAKKLHQTEFATSAGACFKKVTDATTNFNVNDSKRFLLFLVAYSEPDKSQPHKRLQKAIEMGKVSFALWMLEESELDDLLRKLGWGEDVLFKAVEALKAGQQQLKAGQQALQVGQQELTDQLAETNMRVANVETNIGMQWVMLYTLQDTVQTGFVALKTVQNKMLTGFVFVFLLLLSTLAGFATSFSDFVAWCKESIVALRQDTAALHAADAHLGDRITGSANANARRRAQDIAGMHDLVDQAKKEVGKEAAAALRDQSAAIRADVTQKTNHLARQGHDLAQSHGAIAQAHGALAQSHNALEQAHNALEASHGSLTSAVAEQVEQGQVHTANIGRIAGQVADLATDMA